MIPHPPRSTLFPYTTLFRSYIGPENLLQMHSAAVTFTSRFSSWYKGIMSKQTRRDFLAMTVASAASVPFMKSFSSAAHAPADRKSTRLNSSHLGISYAVFCLNDPSPTSIYTLSLHDALPILYRPRESLADALGSGYIYQQVFELVQRNYVKTNAP